LGRQNNEIKAMSVIIATGASPKMLGIPSEKNISDKVYLLVLLVTDISIKVKSSL